LYINEDSSECLDECPAGTEVDEKTLKCEMGKELNFYFIYLFSNRPFTINLKKEHTPIKINIQNQALAYKKMKIVCENICKYIYFIFL
jgi:hypothetical protein